MTTAEIKKGKGIEDLFKGFAAGKPEEEKQIEIVEGKLRLPIQEYEKYLAEKGDYGALPLLEMEESIILTPSEINKFLQATINYENHPHYSKYTGVFTSQLIQNSYDAGYNNFTLDTIALKEMAFFCNHLKGEKDLPMIVVIKGDTGPSPAQAAENIRLSVHGNTGNCCGLGAKNSTYNINGNTGRGCGEHSKNSTFNIKGNTGDGCGYISRNSTFNIQGNAGDFCGEHSKNSTYNIRGDTGNKSGFLTENSTFKTPNRKTLQKMLKDVPKGNRIVFIRKNGKEKVMRDYDDS